MKITLLISDLIWNRIVTVTGFGTLFIYLLFNSRNYKKWKQSLIKDQENEYDWIKEVAHPEPFTLDPYLMLNVNGRIVNCSAKLLKTFGWTADELLGTTISKLIADKDSLQIFDEFKKTRTTAPDDVTIIINGITKLGNEVPLEVGIVKWIHKERALWYFTVIMHDITHRVNTQKTKDDLLQYVEQIRKLYHEGEKIGGVAFWKMDCKTGMLIQFSPNFAHLFGIKGDEILVGTLIKRIVADDKVRVAQTMKQASENKTGYEMEYRIITLDGYINTIRSVARAEKNDNGELTYYLGMAQLIKKEKTTWL